MRLRELLALLLVLTPALAGCGPRSLAAPVGGVDLQGGRYLAAFYRAPDYAPEKVAYRLPPFAVEGAQGVTPEAFQPLLQEELAQAWDANGLKQAPAREDAAVLSGTVEKVRVRGRHFRWLIGKVSADLEVSGTIRRGDQVLFAFRDRVRVVSPINPGPAPPKETELLLRQAARIFAAHLLNELLIHGFPAEGG